MRGGKWVLSAALMLLLGVTLVCELWLLPATVERTVEMYPETEPIRISGIIWGVLVLTAFQGILVALLVATQRIATAKAFLDGALVRWLVGLLIALVVLAVTAFAVLAILGFLAPAAILGLLLLTIAATIAALAVGIPAVTRR